MKLKTFSHAAKSGKVFDAVKLPDLIALLAHATGDDPDGIDKIVVPNGADYALIFRPEAPKAKEEKVSKGAASEGKSLMAGLSAKEKEYVRAWAQAIAEGKGSLRNVVDRLQGVVRALADSIKSAGEDLVMPGEEEEELTLPERGAAPAKARAPQMEASSINRAAIVNAARRKTRQG
jgi:hypothetical protein